MSTIEHIQSNKCRQSHYGSSKSSHGYPPPELSIKKMYTVQAMGERADCQKTSSAWLPETSQADAEEINAIGYKDTQSSSALT